MCLFAEVLHSFLNLELWLNNQVRVIPGQVKLSYRQKVQRNAERFGSQGRVRFLSSWSRPGLFMSGGRPGGSGSGPRSGFGPWFGSVLSASCSAVTVAVVGFFCALVYPILRGKNHQPIIIIIYIVSAGKSYGKDCSYLNTKC